jgi:hypothetical protein
MTVCLTVLPDSYFKKSSQFSCISKLGLVAYSQVLNGMLTKDIMIIKDILDYFRKRNTEKDLRNVIRFTNCHIVGLAWRCKVAQITATGAETPIS